MHPAATRPPAPEKPAEPLLLLGDTKRHILEELLAGPQGAPELARSMGIEVNAVRKHLDSLEHMGAVRYEFLRMGTGRPKKRYRLGPVGLELFPRRYDLLFSRLLDTLLQKEGEAYVGAMLAGIAREVAGGIAIPADAPPEERLETLTGALNDLGFRASLETRNGCPCIVNRNCVALRAASRHPGLICRRFHSTLISAALGGPRVELEGCIVRGDPECRHAIHLEPAPRTGFRDKKVSKLRKLRKPP
ncbi:MAG: hypothetical protein HY558_02080 [Euryarchaeota archaeon]|nr:hypothetical protein [Euryarchaeota archaeon]